MSSSPGESSAAKRPREERDGGEALAEAGDNGDQNASGTKAKRLKGGSECGEPKNRDGATKRRPVGAEEALEKLRKPLQSRSDTKFVKAVGLFERLVAAEMTERNVQKFFEMAKEILRPLEDRRDIGDRKVEVSEERRRAEKALLDVFNVNSGLLSNESKEHVRRLNLHVSVYRELDADESFAFNKGVRKVRAAVEALAPEALNGVDMREMWCWALLKLLDKTSYHYKMRPFTRQSVEQLFVLVKRNRLHFFEETRDELDELINEMDQKQKGLELPSRGAVRQLNSKAHPLRKGGSSILR